jgi:hypothetical protein
MLVQTEEQLVNAILKDNATEAFAWNVPLRDRYAEVSGGDCKILFALFVLPLL